MEQENLFAETSFQQSSNDSQQLSQTLPDQKFSHIEATGMMIEDFSNMSISHLLNECQFKKALSLLQAEFDSKKDGLGELNIELVPILNQMAEVQIALAQFSKASDLSHQSQQILQSHQDEPSYNSLMAHTCQIMAAVCRENQDYKEALDLIERSLALSSPDRLEKDAEKHRVKALILCDLQYYKEALQEIQRSLDIAEKSTNPTDHLIRARVYNTLGDIRCTFYDFHQAKIAYETAMEICRTNDLNFHLEMAKACEGFGNSLIYTKKSSLAVLNNAWRALKIYDNCFGKDRHPARISSFLLIVKYFKKEGFQDVKIYTDKAVEEGEAFYGPDGEKTREIRLSAGKASGNRQIKESLVKPILQTSIENMTGRELVNFCIQRCDAILLGGNRDIFMPIYLKTVEIIKGIYGEMSLQMAKIYERLLIFYQIKNKVNEMIPYIVRRKQIYKEIFGDNHIEVANADSMLSKACVAGKHLKEAILYLELALKVQVGFYGEVHRVVIDSYIRLADLYEEDQEPLKSMKTNLKLLKIQEKIGDENVYKTYQAIGVWYTRFNDDKVSENWYKKSYQMAVAKFGVNHENSLDTYLICEVHDFCKDLLHFSAEDQRL